MNYSIKDFSKKTLDDFEAEIKKGNLVLAWVTLEMQNVKKVYKWHRSDTMEKELVPRNLHCVVIKGIKNNKVFYVDPITGHKSINKNVFINRYRQIGSYAVLVGKTETMMQNTSKSTAVEISSDFIIKTGDNYSNIKNLEFDRKNVYISLDRLFYLFSNKKEKENVYKFDNETLEFDLSNKQVVYKDNYGKGTTDIVEFKDKKYVNLVAIENLTSLVIDIN